MNFSTMRIQYQRTQNWYLVYTYSYILLKNSNEWFMPPRYKEYLCFGDGDYCTQVKKK